MAFLNGFFLHSASSDFGNLYRFAHHLHPSFSICLDHTHMKMCVDHALFMNVRRGKNLLCIDARESCSLYALWCGMKTLTSFYSDSHARTNTLISPLLPGFGHFSSLSASLGARASFGMTDFTVSCCSTRFCSCTRAQSSFVHHFSLNFCRAYSDFLIHFTKSKYRQ